MIDIEALKRRESCVGVVGLGYVGRPLAVALKRHFSVVAFDTDRRLVAALQRGVDRTKSVDNRLIHEMRRSFTSAAAGLRRCSFIIITVPTPISADRTPDLEPLKLAASTVGRNLSRGCVVVLESTVYPGVTENVLAPIIAKESGLEYGTGFHLGYSPERINPGDHTRTVDKLVKVVAGDRTKVTELMASVYGMVTGGKIYCAASIKTAEAAKVIENTQRDLNIALMNELSMICDRIGVDTGEVIRTASTKWNFATFEPGLVGGHCIGVDPYYLTFVAKEFGLVPRVTLAGRYLNDAMGSYVAERTIEMIRMHHGSEAGVRVLILGMAFKENVADVRNSRVADIVRVLEDHRVLCSVYDPQVDPNDVVDNYGFRPVSDATSKAPYSAIVLAVKHEVFARTFPVEFLREIAVAERPILVDVKSLYDRDAAKRSGFYYWRL